MCNKRIEYISIEKQRKRYIEIQWWENDLALQVWGIFVLIELETTHIGSLIPYTTVIDYWSVYAFHIQCNLIPCTQQHTAKIRIFKFNVNEHLRKSSNKRDTQRKRTISNGIKCLIYSFGTWKLQLNSAEKQVKNKRIKHTHIQTHINMHT